MQCGVLRRRRLPGPIRQSLSRSSRRPTDEPSIRTVTSRERPNLEKSQDADIHKVARPTVLSGLYRPVQTVGLSNHIQTRDLSEAPSPTAAGT